MNLQECTREFVWPSSLKWPLLISFIHSSLGSRESQENILSLFPISIQLEYLKHTHSLKHISMDSTIAGHPTELAGFWIFVKRGTRIQLVTLISQGKQVSEWVEFTRKQESWRISNWLPGEAASSKKNFEFAKQTRGKKFKYPGCPALLFLLFSSSIVQSSLAYWIWPLKWIAQGIFSPCTNIGTPNSAHTNKHTGGTGKSNKFALNKLNIKHHHSICIGPITITTNRIRSGFFHPSSLSVCWWPLTWSWWWAGLRSAITEFGLAMLWSLFACCRKHSRPKRTRLMAIQFCAIIITIRVVTRTFWLLDSSPPSSLSTRTFSRISPALVYSFD